MITTQLINVLLDYYNFLILLDLFWTLILPYAISSIYLAYAEILLFAMDRYGFLVVKARFEGTNRIPPVGTGVDYMTTCTYRPSGSYFSDIGVFDSRLKHKLPDR